MFTSLFRLGLVCITFFLIQSCSTKYQFKENIPKEVLTCITTDSGGVYGENRSDQGFSEATYFEGIKKIKIQKSIKFESNEERDTFKSDCLDCPVVYNQSAAIELQKTLASDTNRAMYKLFAYSEDDEKEIRLSRKEFNRFMQTIAQTHHWKGFPSFRYNVKIKLKEIDKNIKEINEKNSGNRSKKELADSKKELAKLEKEKVAIKSLDKELKYIDEYLKAYFREGKFIKMEMEIKDIESLISKWIQDNTSLLGPEDINELFKKIFKELTGEDYDTACLKPDQDDQEKCYFLVAGQLGNKKFVTRGGVAYATPHINLSMNLFSKTKLEVTEVDWNAVAADLSRVYFEAMGDAKIGLIAHPDSTLCEIRPDLCYKTDNKKLSQEEFDDAEKYSTKAETLVSTGVGKLIRGGYLFSLNNEAIAKLIETALGVTAKKMAAKIAHCIYTYEKPQNDNSLVVFSNFKEKTVKVIITR
jgi:hypothetical protein